MKTQTNQWVIKVKKMDITEGDIYIKTNRIAYDKAIKELSPNAFKLWSYMSSNQNDYTFALSKEHVLNTINISHGTYMTIKSELIDKGYLLREDGDYYIFYEMPPDMTEEERKKHGIIAYDKGENRKMRARELKRLTDESNRKPNITCETIYIER